MDAFYVVVRVIARFWIWFFLERVEVQHPARVPSMGPVLLCINHPNLIDSLLVGSVLPRKVHYLATAALFRNPLIGVLFAEVLDRLRLSADCVSRDGPLQRRIDGRAGATGSGTGRFGEAGERRRRESTFARGARETNLPWLEAYDGVGPGFLVQQPRAADAVPWQKICGRRGREGAQLALVLLIRDILYPQPQSRGRFTHDPSGNHPHPGGSSC